MTEQPGAVTGGYWNTDTSGRAAAGGAAAAREGRPTPALLAPTGYADLYAA